VSFAADSITLEAVVLSRDGKQKLSARQGGPMADPRAVGTAVAEELLRQGAAPLIEDADTN
jgi:porphobilinogen deaminase